MKTRRRHPASAGRRKLLLAAPALAAATAPAANAVIIFTSVNGGAGLSGNFTTQSIYFSPTAQQAQLSTFPGAEAILGFYGTSTTPYINQGTATFVSLNYSGHFYAPKLAANAVIDNSRTFASYASLHYLSAGQWQADGSHGYLGLKLLSNDYGWAEVSYNVDGSLTLYGFAYENTGAAISTAAVPEPAEAAALAGLVAGSAAAYAARRRRKAQQAA